MPRTHNENVELYYETYGERQQRPIVLVMGLGAQLIHWPQTLIDRLVANGHFVVVFDNRDVGLSTSFSGAGKIDFQRFFADLWQGETPELPYRLSEMASDALAVMDALELRSAHLAGVSMGGCIAQRVTIAQRERVRSLTSIMSTTGAWDLPRTHPDVLARLFGPLPDTPAERAARMIELNRAICVNPSDFDEARMRQKMTLAGQRGHDPACVSRQMAAMIAAGSAEPELRELRIPALVMHGALDPLLPVECGIRTHECLQGSTLWLDEQMGHYLPERALGPMVDAISELTARSDAALAQ
jgi:pimeloyl-ACP methyl ester carboxylesterase